MIKNSFHYFKTSREIIQIAVMMYIRFPLSLRNVEDLLHERGIDVCHESIRLWVDRFGTFFARMIRKRRSQAMRQVNQGSDPPAMVYFYSPDRKGEHPRTFMKGFSGVLQADGFNAMYQPDPEIQVKAERGTTVAFSGCWAHWRRKFYDVHEATNSPIAKYSLNY